MIIQKKYMKFIILFIIALSILIIFVLRNNKSDFENYEVINGHKLYYRNIGDIGPTVVIDTGLGLEGSNYNGLVQGLSEISSVFQYDRLGLGSSDSVSSKIRPRTSQDMVEDLHLLLQKANIPGPYILVAHSIAGFNARLFMDQYSDDIIGIVLIDVSHPDQIVRLYSHLPQESFDTIDFQYSNRKKRGPEFFDWKQSADLVRKTGSFGDTPLVVITAGKELENERRLLQEELCSLSSNSRHIIAEKSDHGIHLDQPQIIIDAIKRIISKNDENI